MDSVLREWSGVCPHCDNPIAYIEVILPVVNDKGLAVVTCDKCIQAFLINEHIPHRALKEIARYAQVTLQTCR